MKKKSLFTKDMEAVKRISILKAIINKGGLMGSCAKIYLDDEVMGHRFIIECSDQCHTVLIAEYFGSELVSEIIKYSNGFNNVLNN